ncbi:MAG: hypothetical protein WCK05_12295, partial [Planctomycetota bacterium]
MPQGCMEVRTETQGLQALGRIRDDITKTVGLAAKLPMRDRRRQLRRFLRLACAHPGALPTHTLTHPHNGGGAGGSRVHARQRLPRTENAMRIVLNILGSLFTGWSKTGRAANRQQVRG